MYENLVKLLRSFKPFVIVAIADKDSKLPKHVKYIYDQMVVMDNYRCFGFRMDAGEGNRFINVIPDPDYGEYHFANPGIFERTDNIGYDVISRFEQTWGLRRGEFDDWFKFVDLSR